MLTRLARAARPRAGELTLLGTLVFAALVALGAALAEVGGLVAAATVAGVLCDVALRLRFEAINLPLTRVSAGMPTRRLARSVPVVLLAALTATRATTVVVALAAFALVAVGVLAEAARLALRTSAARRPVARNLPAAPGPARVRPSSRATVLGAGAAELAVLLPVTLGAPFALVATLAAAGVAVVLALVVGLSRALRSTATATARGAALDRLAAAIDAYAPAVLLVFSGDRSATYQVDTWLPPLEKLDERVLVVLRDRDVFDTLAPTRLPVVCVPDAQDVMSLRLPTARAALFPTNVANNIHLLRLPHVLSTFVGHGDSDKNASYNPYSRVYDEIWVAGPAGRARYQAARVGVDDGNVVEMGRPQLDDLAGPGPSRSAYSDPTLLYAPTWEGWDSTQDHASHPGVGLALVRAAVEGGAVRLVYRPHPLTGRRSSDVRRAHARIVELLRQDSARREAVGRAPHEVVAPGSRPLYGCFAEADALVTDVSSVLSDYLATGRPYAVTNVRGDDEDEFVRRFPAARAGILLGPDGTGTDRLLAVLTGAAPDDLAGPRAELRRDVLGDPSVPAQARFQAAVAALVARSESRLTLLTPG